MPTVLYKISSLHLTPRLSHGYVQYLIAIGESVDCQFRRAFLTKNKLRLSRFNSTFPYFHPNLRLTLRLLRENEEL